MFKEYLNESIIGESVYLKAKEMTNSIENELLKGSEDYLKINTHFLLMNVQLLKNKSQKELSELENISTIKFESHGQMISGDNFEKNKLYLVIGGKVIMSGPFLNDEKVTIELYPNDSFIILKSSDLKGYVCSIENSGNVVYQTLKDININIAFDTEFYEVPISEQYLLSPDKAA